METNMQAKVVDLEAPHQLRSSREARGHSLGLTREGVLGYCCSELAFIRTPGEA